MSLSIPSNASESRLAESAFHVLQHIIPSNLETSVSLAPWLPLANQVWILSNDAMDRSLDMTSATLSAQIEHGVVFQDIPQRMGNPALALQALMTGSRRWCTMISGISSTSVAQ